MRIPHAGLQEGAVLVLELEADAVVATQALHRLQTKKDEEIRTKLSRINMERATVNVLGERGCEFAVTCRACDRDASRCMFFR